MVVWKDLISSVVILVICAFLWYVTTTFETDPLGALGGLEASQMPQMIIGLIAFLALVMLVQSFLNGGEAFPSIPPWQVGVTAILLGCAALAKPVIGVPLTFFLVCAVLPTLWGSRKYAVTALFALGVPAAIYLIFVVILGLRLPMGPLASLGL